MALCEKFELWEQEGPESMNEYQNYKLGQPRGGTGGGGGRRAGTRPSSAVNANSRLLKPTYATRGKAQGAGEWPYDNPD